MPMTPQPKSAKAGSARKPAAAPGSKSAKAGKPKNPLIEKRSRNFGIGASRFTRQCLTPAGQDVQPTRDLTRFVKWPQYVRLQRQRTILAQRLKVPPAIAQFVRPRSVRPV